MAAISAAVQMHPPSSTALREMQYLRDEMQQAEADVRAWTETNRNRTSELHFRCSEYTIAKHGELVRAIRELHDLGFQLFETRVAAMQLGQVDVRRLFRNCRDGELQARIPEPSPGDLRLAWFDDATGATHYLAEPPPTLASRVRDWQATGAEVGQLVKQAKTELAAARKVSQAAA